MLSTQGGGQALWSPPTPELIQLDNGVRVVHLVRNQSLSAICVLQDFGFVDDPPARAGFAHLMEHLAAADDFITEGVASAAHLNGRTRFDSIDFYAVADDDEINTVVNRMASRFSMALDASILKRQMDIGVEELRAQVTGTHLGGFPWTELPSTLFADWAHAHNGYGTEDSVRAVSFEDALGGLKEIGRRPTTVGLVGPLRSRDKVRRVFERLPSTLAPARPVPEPKAADSTVRTVSGHRGQRALAAGMLLPGSRHDARSVSSARVVARILKRAANHGDHGPATTSEDFGVGFFGPFSTLTSDVFIATAFVGDALDPEQHRERIRHTLRLASNATEESIAKAIDDESLTLASATDDSVTLSRFLASQARSEGDSTDFLNATVNVTDAEVREVAYALSVAPMGILDRVGLVAE